MTDRTALAIAYLILVVSVVVLGFQIERGIEENRAVTREVQAAVVDGRETSCGTWQSTLYVLESQKALAVTKEQRESVQSYIDQFVSDYQVKCEFYDLKDFPR